MPRTVLVPTKMMGDTARCGSLTSNEVVYIVRLCELASNGVMRNGAWQCTRCACERHPSERAPARTCTHNAMSRCGDKLFQTGWFTAGRLWKVDHKVADARLMLEESLCVVDRARASNRRKKASSDSRGTRSTVGGTARQVVDRGKRGVVTLDCPFQEVCDGSWRFTRVDTVC